MEDETDATKYPKYNTNLHVIENEIYTLVHTHREINAKYKTVERQKMNPRQRNKEKVRAGREKWSKEGKTG